MIVPFRVPYPLFMVENIGSVSVPMCFVGPAGHFSLAMSDLKASVGETFFVAA